jgi:hypothetical protein
VVAAAAAEQGEFVVEEEEAAQLQEEDPELRPAADAEVEPGEFVVAGGEGAQRQDEDPELLAAFLAIHGVPAQVPVAAVEVEPMEVGEADYEQQREAAANAARLEVNRRNMTIFARVNLSTSGLCRMRLQLSECLNYACDAHHRRLRARMRKGSPGLMSSLLGWTLPSLLFIAPPRLPARSKGYNGHGDHSTLTRF